nr:hypothetical protein [Nonomuraea mesophila]
MKLTKKSAQLVIGRLGGQVRCGRTHFSTASHTLRQTWKRSVTCTASGAAVCTASA